MLRIAALALVLAAPLPVHAAQALDPNAVVYCHDAKRNLVQRVRVRHCAGEIVTPDKAAALRAEIEAERKARRARSLTRDLGRKARGLVFHSAGAAFAVNRAGDLLTSAHVVRGCDVLEARNDDSAIRHPVRFRAMDARHDLAVVSLGAAPPATLPFAPSAPADGEPLALIGYPSEGLIRVRPRLTPVLVSHAISNPAASGFVGVAGEVRRGNSGGPALDSRGGAVGVLKAKVNSVAARRLTGRTLKNLGVVVDRAAVLQFLESTGTRYAVDRPDAPEMTVRALFDRARKAVYRIDCLKRK